MDALISQTNVFIVDDSDSVRRRMIAMLETLTDVSVIGEAATAREAIAGIVATSPDVVLLDLDLGEGSGFDVLRVVRQKLPTTQVVVLTNHSEPQYRDACLKAGAYRFLDKSTQFDCVRGVIAKLNHQAKGRAT